MEGTHVRTNHGFSPGRIYIYTINILHIMVDIKQEGDVGERKREKYIYTRTKLCLCV